MALALAKEKKEQQKALVRQERIKRRAAQVIANKKAKLIKLINNCKETLNFEATSPSCIGYQELINSGTYNNLAYEHLLSKVNAIKEKERQLRKIEKAKNSLISQIENCSKLFDIGFKPSSCSKYKLVIDKGNYKELSYGDLKDKIGLTNNIKQKFTVPPKTGIAEIRAKENLVRGIDACKNLIKLGFKNDSCAKYEEVIKAGDYKNLNYDELVSKIN
ncbi:MAG: hypothetical protein JKY88_16475 [Pseudomonadales bacterium]|nr:hypothetical protein [Pseudomonadales bacterium]